MNGPKIIEQPQPRAFATREQRPTGIRRAPSSTCTWQVIINGRLVEEFTGLGAQSKARRMAGTDKELA